ncbi:hypothetical protein N825_09215 [Skermanella stibiiresistens SB22]|uniref:Cellulose synthase catalytic subunit [UDP-forming] n=1 Tax=Skermanella stibiiresistens SB22 TaxID=1385369 RepID=W9GVD3_9PROT|nr:hypothetical protein N825_09215 [Skermanella stibiiresistens SB22]
MLLTAIGCSATLPVSLEAQLLVAWSFVAALFLISSLKTHRTGRILGISFAAFVTIRYIIWRTTNTLPAPDDLVNFVPGMILYVAEIFSFMMFLLSTFVISNPLNRKSIPIDVTDPDLPSVDIVIPTYDEEANLLLITLTAAVSLDYPKSKFKVYLLDDGGTAQKCNQADALKADAARRRAEKLKELCAATGAIYLTRERNEHAKAGNINASLSKIGGDLIAILDADHVPSSDFLLKTVGFFVKDPGIALVQTPHFFLNPDPVEYNLRTFPRMPSENELFYRNIQPGLDRWNAAFFCGSAALLRRTALEEVGGISGTSITEDCETAMDLHAQGYRSAYLDEPLIAGLQPESFVSFIGQRSRWAQGMIQILLLKNVLWRRGLTVAQRLCYLSNSLYWFFVFIRPIFVLGPLCYLFFGLQIVRTNVPEFFAYILPHIVASVMLPNILNGKVRWPFISELYEYVLSLHLSRAVLSVLWNPRAPQFKVTAKGETMTSNRASPLAGPFVWMVLILSAGMVAAVWRFIVLPDSREIIGIVAFWNGISLLLALAGLGAVYEQRQIRRFPRIGLQVPAVLKLDGISFPAQVLNGSANGLNIELPIPARSHLSESMIVTLLAPTQDEEIEKPITLRVRRMSVSGGTFSIGCEFNPVSQTEAAHAVHLVYGNSRIWAKRWQGRVPAERSALRSFAFLTGLALTRGLPAAWNICKGAVTRRGAAKESSETVPAQ